MPQREKDHLVDCFSRGGSFRREREKEEGRGLLLTSLMPKREKKKGPFAREVCSEFDGRNTPARIRRRKFASSAGPGGVGERTCQQKRRRGREHI